MGQVIPIAPRCYENLRLPHQIVLRLERGTARLYVSCTCLRLAGGGFRQLASGIRLPAADAQAAWLAHMATIREHDHDDENAAHDPRAAAAELHRVQPAD